jgi:hypothetical protein
LDVASPFVLGHLATSAAPEIHITVDDAPTRADHNVPPEGRLMASLEFDTPQYALVDRGDEGFLYRLHNLVDIEVAPNQHELRCQFVDGATREVLPVLLAGNVLAMLLLLRGELVLHASAVERDGRAIGLVGHSGAGKSTLAAMACLAGCKLVTDDVLRVVPTETGALCYRGSAALRLRPSSRAVTGAILSDDRMSADGRHLLSSEPTDFDEIPLEAIFIPRLREVDHPLIRTPLEPKAAFLSLIEFPRVQNWNDPVTAAEHFAKLAAIVERTPVYALDIPRGVAVGSRWFEQFTDLLFEASSTP